jgi:hypothetical protein
MYFKCLGKNFLSEIYIPRINNESIIAENIKKYVELVETCYK